MVKEDKEEQQNAEPKKKCPTLAKKKPLRKKNL